MQIDDSTIEHICPNPATSRQALYYNQITVISESALDTQYYKKKKVHANNPVGEVAMKYVLSSVVSGGPVPPGE